MLILTRRVGESIKIGDNVVVTVLNKSGNQVKIGIEAPKSVNVVRTELLAPNAESIGAPVGASD